jgi:SAM-dependent methyltransferase
LTFQDHFSAQAERYTRFRPRYPRSLFEFLATLPARTERAWDCGTGNGQAAVALAEFFEEVVATDPSAQQIAHAEQHPRVRYLVAAAEHAPLADESVDLVTVAQALHWFDLEGFYAEVRRVARPGGIVAAWGYALLAITPEIDQVVRHLYSDVLGRYWPPERRVTETRYATVAFPFRELPGPTLEMTAQWNLDELVGYVGTWSSVQQYVKRHAANPLSQVRDELGAAWGSPQRVRRVTWPLFLRVGRIDQAGRRFP